MIEISDIERRRAFSMWLRTGRLPSISTGDGIELKFNPWHDPENGRFTFRGTGRYFPRRGGGSFGGGGASGSWGQPRPQRRAESVSLPKPFVAPTSPSNSTNALPRRAVPSTDKPFSTIERNGYTYGIDERGRTRGVSGPLTVASAPTRSRKAQKRAGGADRRGSDDGGHYIAARFNGPAEAFNHFAQDANFNRGRYRLLEDEWAREKRAGRIVTVKIVPVFDSGSERPSALNIWWVVDGRRKSIRLPNEPAEDARGK